MAVEQKANEIVVAPELLQTLPLSGRVVTGDATFAQHTLTKQMVEAQGDYLWIIKDNQPPLRATIARLLAPEKCTKAHAPLHTDFQSPFASTKDTDAWSGAA